MTITASKTTDKLMVIEGMVDQLPVDKIKTINIIWKSIDGLVVPNVIIEMFEEYPENDKPPV